MASKVQMGVIDAPQKGLIFSRIDKNVPILMFSSAGCLLIYDFRSKVRKKNSPETSLEEIFRLILQIGNKTKTKLQG